ncbi:hypothetical protein DPM19_20290 [Actinomadura craniellae]|uniref:Uncharacterized protein n=1 Tax=Actinomadura craniellae TaxID=2231787 RepID=A0A365H306_9ACTN|nr:hypothetical protein [Actinomadura craniellae]RAY13408.1 hypothetical protein DPM19_20290 [Actinomadura craniellae]
MPQELPGWVAELTDPRRARTTDELADRLVPLAEHAIDVSRRLQAVLHEINEPFKREALYDRVERLKARSNEALGEITGEIEASGRQRIERIWANWCERGAGDELDAELRRRLGDDVVPELRRQERAVAEQVADRTSGALDTATETLLTRVEELATVVTDLIHEVLPRAREGLELAGRISGLSGRARKAGHDEIPADLRAESYATAAAFDEAMGRLELEWAAFGGRSATVRAALRGAEETAFSQVTAEMTRCVADLAPVHVKMLDDAEARAMALIDRIGGG